MRRSFALATTLAIIAPTARAAIERPIPTDVQTDIETVKAHQVETRRVLDLGYRVAHALAASCPGSYDYGFAIDHPANYSPPLAAALGFKADAPYPRVIAVAAGSPAEASGLRVGDFLAAAGAVSLAAQGSGFAPIETAIDRIERAREGHRLILTAIRSDMSRTVTVDLTPGCGGWFDVKPSASHDATSNLRWIQPTDMLLHALPRDDDLAFVLGHEMGHRILRLRALREHRSLARRNCGGDCEIFADSVAVAVMPCLGYDPARALDVLQRLRRARDVLGSFLGLYAARTQALRAAIAHGDGTCRAAGL